MESLVVREALRTDLPAIAAIHKAQFGDHLLGQYSVSTLTRFYETFLGDEIFLAAEFSGEICGFVLGGERPRMEKLKNRFVKSNFGRLLGESMLRPRVWGIFANRLFSGGGGAARPTSKYSMRLLSIAVSEKAKGQGIAGALVKNFEGCLEDGSSYGLSVIADNERAIAFYRKTGYDEEFRSGHSVFFHKSTAKGIPGDDNRGQ